MKHSIIIPTKDDIAHLLKLLEIIFSHSIESYEIIIIDSSSCKNDKFLSERINSANLAKIVYHHMEEPVYPGHARNLGLSLSKGTHLAFLDAKTRPTDHWFRLLDSEEVDRGIYGLLEYSYDNLFQKFLIAASYGFLPLITVPGSIIPRETLNNIGIFISNVRAGEDTDWLLRSKELIGGLKVPEFPTIEYHGLIGLSLHSVLKKWFINYRSCRNIPHIRDHKFVYLGFTLLFTIFIAYSWNRLFASWDENSFFYVNNITKIVLGVLASFYFLSRSFLLPFIRGTNIKFLISGGFLPIFFLGSLIDLTKLIAFIPNLSDLKNNLRNLLFRGNS